MSSRADTLHRACPADRAGIVATLIVGNSRTEEMVGELAALSTLERQFGGCAALRLLWLAESGDVVVLPYPPRAEYLAYVTNLTGADPESLLVLCPPPGALGADLLTPDRTADPAFRKQVRAAVRARGVDRVTAVYKDVPVTQFAAAVGVMVPGHAFSAQGGDALINSKAGFRGTCCRRRRADRPGFGHYSPGRGQESGHRAVRRRPQRDRQAGVLRWRGRKRNTSPGPGVRVAGALTAVVLADATAVADYFALRWDWLTAGGRHRLVVERYLTECDTVYGEYLISDAGPALAAVGEILMAPVPIGEMVPAQSLTPAARSTLVEAGVRLCGALHAIGYRGYLSTDAVLTPNGEVFLTETNARMSGSTHLHAAIHARVLDTPHRGHRVALELHDWAVPSFAAAVERLTGAGLAFTRDTGLGVVLDLRSDARPERGLLRAG